MSLKLKTLSAAMLLAAAAHVHAQDANENVNEKANAYIECYNRADSSAQNGIDRYASWVQDLKKGPTGKEKNIYGVHTIHENVIKLCKEDIEKALALEPAAKELDEAAKAYLDALLPLSERLDEAGKYYERENYKDDKFAKGKEMHGPLVEAMDAFNAASDKLRTQLESHNDKAQAEQLAAIEKEAGKNFDYHLLATVIDAKSALNILAEEKFDVDAAGKVVSAFEEKADALEAYLKEHPDEKPRTMIMLDNKLEEYRVALKQRLRRVRDNTPYNQGEKMNLNPQAGWMVEGSPYKVLRAYNELIDTVNR